MKTISIIKNLMLIVTLLLFASCASVQPTTETYTSYRVFKVPNNYTLNQVRDVVVHAAKLSNSNAVVINGLPPHPLPKQPGHFEIKNTQLGPVTMAFPQMPGSTISIRSTKRPSNAETMNWIVGIYPYEGGYSVQMLMVATYRRGTSSFNPIVLGAALGRELAYEQNGGVEGRIKYWFDDLAKKITSQIDMDLVEAYPNE